MSTHDFIILITLGFGVLVAVGAAIGATIGAVKAIAKRF